MTRPTNLLMLAALLVGCEPEDADIATDPNELPDIAGDYDVTVDLVEGCDPEVGDLEWMVGPMQITGEPDTLTFELAGGDLLLGAIDTAYAVDAEGTVTPYEAEMDVLFQGVAVLGDEGWTLDGEVIADVIESTGETIACTLTGQLEAQQRP